MSLAARQPGPEQPVDPGPRPTRRTGDGAAPPETPGTGDPDLPPPDPDPDPTPGPDPVPPKGPGYSGNKRPSRPAWRGYPSPAF